MATAANLPAERQPANPLVALRSQLEQRASEFKMVLPAHISPEKFQRTILTAVQTNPKLLTADRRSFINACMKAAQDGLLPDGREAVLTEFQTSQKDANGEWVKVRLIQYMPMVFGLRKKILQSGEVKDIFAAVVYRQEHEDGLFVYEEGSERQLRHKPLLDPDFDPKDEDIIAAYSVATLADGSRVFDVMRRSEINKVRQMSQTGALGRVIQYGPEKGTPIEPKGPWVDWFSEMAKKSVIRRHSKMLPMSGDIIDVEASDELAAARSAVSLLDSANEDAPLAIGADHAGDTIDEIDHDPETGEIIDAEPVGKEKAPPRRQRKKAEEAQATEQRQDTITPDNPAAAEGKADDDRGEQNADDGHPARRAADAIIAEAGAVTMMPDLSSLKSRSRSDVEAMPEDMRGEVEAAFAAADKRLRGAK